MIWFILGVTIAALAWYYFVRPMNTFTNMGVKQTKPWPFFGDQWLNVFKKLSAYESIEFFYKMYPDARYSGFYQFNIPTLLLRDPELIKKVTVKDFDHFTDHRSFIDADSDPLWGGNLFVLKGRKWREMRATLSGAFTSNKVKSIFQMMNDTAHTFTKYFIEKDMEMLELNLKEIYTCYTNDVIATTAFGLKLDSLEQPNNVFYMMGRKLTSFSGHFVRLKFFVNFVFPQLFKILRIPLFDNEVSAFFYNIIHEIIEAKQKKDSVRKDMVDLLLNTRKKTDSEKDNVISTSKGRFKQARNLTNQEIVSQALIFFFAGFESTSNALCFGSYELALNKNIQERLRKEIQKAHEANDGKLTYDSLLELKYMNMVVLEVLRKWPALPGVDRVVTKPYTIEPSTPNENLVYLKTGSIVFLPIIGLHKDPQYFPDPEKFDPERFSEENKDTIKPYSYIPFGSGPRKCIASRFAILEIKVLLYHLLLNFEILPTKKTIIPFKFDRSRLSHTLEGGFWLGLKRIKKGE